MSGLSCIAGTCVVLLLLRNAPLPTPRWWQLGVIAALLQVPAYCWTTSDYVFRISYLLLCCVAWCNRTHAGGGMIFVGMLLNAIPILILGRMPIGADMLAWGRQAAALGNALSLSKDLVVAHSPILMLGDVIPVTIVGWRAAWSIGDVVLCLGVLRYSLANERIGNHKATITTHLRTFAKKGAHSLRTAHPSR